MDKQIQDKVIVITGGAMGIGYNIADKFLEKGVKALVIIDVSEKNGNDAVNTLNLKYGEKAMFLKCDIVTDLEAASKIIFDTYKNVDVLINNAGYLNDNSLKKTIDVNVTALIEWSYKFHDHMRKDKGGKGGTIINLSSILGLRIIEPYVPIYQAAKLTVTGFSKSLGHVYNFNKTGVRVLAICPGFTRTKLVSQPAATIIREDEQVQKDFENFLKNIGWQNVDPVGDAAVEVFEKADSGTAWVIEDAKPIYEV